jgi:glycine reductase
MPPRSLDEELRRWLEKLKAVHYINQFSDRSEAMTPPEHGIRTEEKAVGPASASGCAGDRAEIVATIICGDNTAAENLEG